MPEAPHHPPPADAPMASGRRVGLVLLLLGGGFGAVLVAGFAARDGASQQLRETTVAAALPTVAVVQPQAAAVRPLVLPARLAAWQEAPVYARNNGFIRARMVDIGDEVRAGEVLAIIDAPEIEQQLAAATAQLGTITAQRNLSAATARRWEELAARSIVSQQTADEKRGDLAARESMLTEATANVNRLRAQLSFNRVVAPFDGTVTSRGTDVGALIVAGDTRATPLFTIADRSRIRVYVRVPQAYAGFIAPGLKAAFTVPDHPNRRFTAEVQRSAEALDAQSGAMLVQLVVDNAEGLLKPGGYAQLRLEPPQDGAAAVRIPSSALIFRGTGLSVAVVDAAGKVEIRPVRIAQDLGAELVIGEGLALADRVIDSPSDALRSGDRVRVTERPRG